jgi:hypothetical protein
MLASRPHGRQCGGRKALLAATVDAMTTTGDVTPIKVSGPAGLLAAVPPMLGFHPTNSLVLMCVSGNRRRVGPVARVDLPAGHDRAMAKQLTRHARNHADEVVVISYQEGRKRPPLLDDVLVELDRAGVPVMEAIVVRGGRARPALNAAIERVHPGIELPDAEDPQVAALAAAGALAGRSVLINRDQLRQSIAGPTGIRLQAAERAVDEVLAGHIRSAEATKMRRDLCAPAAGSVESSRSKPGGGDMGFEGLFAQSWVPHSSAGQAIPRAGAELPGDVAELLHHAFAQLAAGGAVQVRIAVELAIDFSDVLVRDSVLAKAVSELEEPWLPLLISCASWTPDFLAAELCSLLSVVAYRHGDGALAQLAVDRCLAAEPRHPLAQLMIAIMSAGVRPEELERIGIHLLTAEYFDPFNNDGPGDCDDERYGTHPDDPEPRWES